MSNVHLVVSSDLRSDTPPRTYEEVLRRKADLIKFVSSHLDAAPHSKGKKSKKKKDALNKVRTRTYQGAQWASFVLFIFLLFVV